MKLYKRKEIKNLDAIKEQMKKAYGIKGDHLPHGMATAIGFSFGNIYIDNYISSKLTPIVEKELELCLSKFRKNDFGMLTEEELEDNSERIFFGHSGLIARYEISIGTIELHVNRDTTISCINKRK